MNNPFTPAAAVAKKLKLMLVGDSSTGKTIAAMSFNRCGRVAYIDTERSTDLYLAEFGDNIDILRTSNLSTIEETMKFIKADGGKTYAVLVIDSITPIYQTLVEAEMKRIEAKPSSRENSYTNANKRIRYLYNDLVDLPVHVVVTARLTDKYKSNPGGYFEVVGTKPDTSKDIPFSFDFIIEMAADYKGKVTKQRLMRDKLKVSLDKVDWEVFAPIALRIEQGEQLSTPNDREEVDKLAEETTSQNKPVKPGPRNFTNKAAIKGWWNGKMAQKLDPEFIKATLGVTELTKLGTMTMDEADALLVAALEGEHAKEAS